MQREVVISANFIFFLLFHGSSSADSKIKSRKPCKRLLFYFHGIIYNGQNAKNATSAIAASPQWGNKTILAGQNHFGDVVVFDDPITLDNNLHSPQVVGRAQGMYLYDRKDYFTAWLGFSFWFNSTNYMGTMNFIGADPLNKTRDISVVGGTGDFFMARGIATIMTDAFENEEKKLVFSRKRKLCDLNRVQNHKP